MRRLLFSAVLTVLFCTASLADNLVAKGKTHTTLGDYKIESMDKPVVLNGKELDAFTISYQNSDLKVTVAVEKTRNCKNYYVLSDRLSVKYVCNPDYFGVERLGKEFEKEGYKTSNDALNTQQYYHQRVITDGSNGHVDNTRLIAAYYPFLLKDQESITAAK